MATKEEGKKRKFRTRHKSGTVTYIVQTAAKLEESDDKAQLQQRLAQEKEASMMEGLATCSLGFDVRALDELATPECEAGFKVRSFLNSLEMLAK